MKVKLKLLRANQSSDDIVVQSDATATVSQVAAAIAEADPHFDGNHRAASYTLQVFRPGFTEPQVLHPEKHIEEASLGSGLTVSLLETSSQRAVETMMGESHALLYVTAGPDRGKTFDIETGTTLLGRTDDCLVQLDDPTISKLHARLELVGNSLLIVDLNSANGVSVDGGLVSRVQLQEGDRFSVGDTEIRIAELSSLKPVEFESNSGATVLFNRSPRVERRHPGKEFRAPHPPGEEDPLPFPWLIMIAPLIMGGILFSITQSPLTIAFIALSPILMIGNYVSNRTNRKRRFQLGLERFKKQLTELDKNLSNALKDEQAARLAESPSTQEVLDDVVNHGSLLWTRRIEHWSFLNLRMGIGDLPSRNTVSEITGEEKAMPEYLTQVTDIIEKYRLVTGVPVIENLAHAGALGLAGPREISADVARSVLVQLTGLHSHVDLSLAAIVSSDWSEEFSWLRWVPHTASPQSPLGDFPHLADSASSVANLLTRLEELIENRVPKGSLQLSRRPAVSFEDSVISQAAKVGQPDSDNSNEDLPEPVLVLLVAGDPPVDRARLIQIAERGAAAGIFPIWVAPKVAELPAVCRTFFDLERYHENLSANFVRVGISVESLLVERVGQEAVNAFARFIAPIVDISGVVEDSSDLPRSISLLSLLGTELAESSAAVIDRWNQNESILDRSAPPPPGQHKPGKLRALVGQAGADAMHLDLRAQGPHALVGGTTGSGKSEFLQAWVLGMAAEYSPDRVTFLFVDYKGGSAFADCVKLPHCVGLVTDLSPHLVRRALTSLRAELHYREHLFNRKKAKDILELEKRRDPETPPALILVIDEFAALVSDVPDFVDGVVDIAQRGRSLGIHLIMATQRPAGVIKDNLRANTNLRIALRMADESDSVDVVGEKVAASFDPSIPGRGIAKTGPGRLTPFQSGYAGGWTSNEPSPPSIDISELRFGTQLRWQPPQSEKMLPDQDPGPTDQARLVGSIIGAAEQAAIPLPRRPWLDELAEHYDLTKLRQRTDTKLAFAVTDKPALQLQETSYFLPDLDGHLAVYGTSGSGKTVLLRTLAAAAGITPRGGKVSVYALDFGSGGLRMLDVLPHVGSVIDGSDQERVVRLFRTLKAELEKRSRQFSDVGTGNITEYRELAKDPEAERILILVDNYPAFRNDFEVGAGKAEWYDVFQQILSEGRALGIHIALSADRSSSVPGSVNANISKRIVLRLAEEAAYSMLDVPSDIITSSSAPGRAIIDDLESQIALFGTDRSVAGQASALQQLAEAITAQGRKPAAPIRSLPKQIALDDLPATVDDRAVIGVSDVDLEAIGIDLSGVFLIAGPPASGRSTALLTFSKAIERVEPEVERYYFGSARSSMVAAGKWTEVALNPDGAAELAKILEPRVAEYEEQGKRLVVVIESLGDFLSSTADAPLVALIKSIRRSNSFLLAEGDTTAWASSWPLMAEIKSARRGFLLQPEGMDGDSILRTSIPRGTRADFPEGRGYLVQSGKAVRVQVALPYPASE